MEYVHQSAGSIRLCLATGQFDYDQFTVLEKKKISFGDITIHIGILGESHYISFEGSAHDLFHEICACTAIDTNSAQNIVQLDLLPNITRKQTHNAVGGFNYIFSYQYRDYEYGVREMNVETERARKTEHITELSHAFPASDGATDGAVTKVFVEQGTQLAVQTFHTYPNEDIIVSTRSRLFEVK